MSPQHVGLEGAAVHQSRAGREELPAHLPAPRRRPPPSYRLCSSREGGTEPSDHPALGGGFSQKRGSGPKK